MIGKDEIKQKSLELDIHHANVERDYVFGWLLKSIFENDFLRDRLIFKGGNCLRKAFYPNTRFSADLDFSVTTAIDAERMGNEINEACHQAQENCGVEFLVDRNTFEAGPMIDRDRRSYKGRVYFTDFFGNQENLTISVKLDVTEFDRLLLSTVTKPLIHPYSDAVYCQADLRCMAMEEIVANKMKCLIQRRHSHDLFDLVYTTFIDQSVEIDRKIVLNTFLRKTIFSSDAGAAKSILLGIPLAIFSGAWEKYIRCPISTRFSFEKAIEGFKDSIEGLFDGVRTDRWGEQLFFGPEHRNLIMDAGSQRKMMRLKYHGFERLIEPYALSYKRAEGKQAREYFYAYDTTGGSSGNVGIKTFFNTDIDALEITETNFEPRYEIELSKAGEQARKAYFGKPFSDSTRLTSRQPRARTSLPRAFKGFEQSHKVQCPYCQKIFTRKTTSLDLKEHKAPNGYRCGGRRGYRVY